jgi:hypothetical protein
VLATWLRKRCQTEEPVHLARGVTQREDASLIPTAATGPQITTALWLSRTPWCRAGSGWPDPDPRTTPDRSPQRSDAGCRRVWAHRADRTGLMASAPSAAKSAATMNNAT